jgi:activator of Hsp90 ATPase-like protein
VDCASPLGHFLAAAHNYARLAAQGGADTLLQVHHDQSTGYEIQSMTRSLSPPILLALAALWPSLVASSQEVRNTSVTNGSGERVLRIESTVPASPKEIWKAFTTVDGLKTWIAPVVSIDLRVGGTLSTHYDKTAVIGSPGTIRLGIVNYLEGEQMTLKVKLTKRFGEKVCAEDQNLQEIIQLVPWTNGTTKVISSMVGWGTGKEWDDTYDFFAKGNEWTYQQLVKSFSANRK